MSLVASTAGVTPLPLYVKICWSPRLSLVRCRANLRQSTLWWATTSRILLRYSSDFCLAPMSWLPAFRNRGPFGLDDRQRSTLGQNWPPAMSDLGPLATTQSALKAIS